MHFSCVEVVLSTNQDTLKYSLIEIRGTVASIFQVHFKYIAFKD